MKTEIDDVLALRTQLAEKQELVAALTSQLEKSAIQLDRLRRSGADRLSAGQPAPGPAVSPELTGKLSAVLDEWQEFQPTERIERIESGIEQLLELVIGLQGSITLDGKESSAPARPLTNEEFWAAEKARLLGDASSLAKGSAENSRSHRPADSSGIDTSQRRVVEEPAEIDESIYAEIGIAPEAPEPVSTIHDVEELLEAVKSRDNYIQYLTSRLRIAESRKLLPVRWDLLESAPDRYRERLESLEVVLKDHLRQAEVSHSLERALLGRERAKLAQVKQNLETQIKKLAMLGQGNPASAPPQHVDPPPVQEAKGDAESRWKRIFSR